MQNSTLLEPWDVELGGEFPMEKSAILVDIRA